MSGRELIECGFVSQSRTIASVSEYFGMPGSPDPARLLSTHVMGGVDLEVIASRGFDIGRTWWRGQPISWVSPIADARALDVPSGDAWADRFLGGLLTTCGPYNIGAARGSHGMHGTFSHTPSSGVQYSSDTGVVLSARIDLIGLFGASLSVTRTISSTAGGTRARVSLVDEVTNVGAVPAPVAMMYHINLGAPLVLPGTSVEVAAEDVVPRDVVAEVPTPTTLPEPCTAVTEAVFEHVNPRRDSSSFAHAVVTGHEANIRVEVAWSADTLPQLYQWVLPTRGRWALGIEPASAPLFGDGRDSEGAGVPQLAPGESRRHEIIIAIGDNDSWDVGQDS